MTRARVVTSGRQKPLVEHLEHQLRLAERGNQVGAGGKIARLGEQSPRNRHTFFRRRAWTG